MAKHTANKRPGGGAKKASAFTISTAHLDTVWRWNLATTIQEYLLSTLQQNFYLFEKLPEYRFNFEGAYRYELIQEYYPDLFERVKGYAADGKWNPCGSVYENGDVNIPSPEALLRNILLGNQYFEESFGAPTKDLFLPDCFGFGYALPSVMHHAGLTGFSTQKLRWGGAYGCPFDLGIWSGVDGSSVYASLNGQSYRHQFTNVRGDAALLKKIKSNQALYDLPMTMIYHGVGDQGGAPTEKDAQAVCSAIRENDHSSLEILASTPEEVFEVLDRLPESQKNKLPRWDNELLMTDHGVGGYTARGMSKRLNRACETLADRAEKGCVCASWTGAYRYPQEPLTQSWKRVIAHQFHDDLPGTSLMEVYNRSWNDYFLSLNQFQTEYTASVGAVANELDTDFVQGVALVVHNTLEFDRTEAIRATIRMKENCPYVRIFDHAGKEVPSQVVHKRGKQFEIVFTAAVPSLGYRVYDAQASGVRCQCKTGLRVTPHTLENEKYQVKFNKNGDIASVIDKMLGGRELLQAPIKMALFRDIGSFSYPAWELRYEDLCAAPYAYANTPVFEIVESGPARAAVQVTRTVEDTTFIQTVSLSHQGVSLQVENEIDWQSRKSLLKTQFPFTAFHEQASYDLGMGVIRRGNNTPSFYEVPAQKWADLTDRSGEFGISILSDSKYGWDKPDGHTLRLTGIHTPAGAFSKGTRQDLMDVGRNRYGFALYSHSGGFEQGTQQAAAAFCQPMAAFQTDAHRKGPLGPVWSFGALSHASVLLKAMKKAERSEEVILRFQEGTGQSVNGVTFTAGEGILSAREVNGCEKAIGGARVAEGKLVFDLHPYQPRSFAVTLVKPKKKAARQAFQKMDLDYNAGGVTKNRNRQWAILCASGTSLPAELFPGSVTCGGIVYRLGDGNQYQHILLPKGQQIDLPSGCNKLYLLAASTRGDKELTFLVDQKPRILRIHDFQEPIGQWDMAGLNQGGYTKDDAVLALEFTHTHSPQDDNYARQAFFFQYELNVRKARQITLPEDATVAILAMTAVKQFSATHLVTPLYDHLGLEGSLPPPQKPEDKLDFLTIQAGKYQNQREQGKGKGILRDNPVTNLVRSFRKKAER